MMPRRFAIPLGVALMLVPTSLVASGATAQASPPIRSTYIVQFSAGSDAAHEVTGSVFSGVNVDEILTAVFPGAIVRMTAAQAAGMAHNPHVTVVEKDSPVYADATQNPAPSWGLDRIDQGALPLDQSYGYTSTGAGVTAYVIDTGIYPDKDFGNRLLPGASAIRDGRGTSDCNGHGTHVAGTIGGTTYGVAKQVSLVPVRVLNCQGSGTTSGVVSGINWVVSNHVNGPAVANMSLGGGASTTLDDAVRAMITDGVTVAVAAGNSGANACNYSPARVSSALTVGATDAADTRASWSNYGSCVDLFAPGVGIKSDWLKNGTNTISGTSMASPHVAGVAARYLSGHTAAPPTEVSSAITSQATSNKVINPGTGSPNLLLFMSSGS